MCIREPIPPRPSVFLQAKEGFYAMLDECKKLPSTAKFSKARDLLELDPRWQAVSGGGGEGEGRGGEGTSDSVGLSEALAHSKPCIYSGEN